MIPKFNVQVKPLLERQSEIENETINAARKYRFHGFRNEPIDLPVIRIPISLPIYRMENYRTRLQQKAWIKERSVPENFFFLGEENESVQQEQHKFLWDLANEETKNVAQIIDILQSEGQKDPLLITANGVVVNGNRRLAAMREIYKSDTDNYSNFMHIDCMVLPIVATEDDLKETEVKLQMTPETRLPYDYISESIAIQDLFENRGKDLDAIAVLMGLKDVSKVKIKLAMLTEIDLYLKEWKGKEGEYKLLRDAEQIVTELTIRFGRKEGIQQEIARRIGWILLDQRGKDGRVYNYKEVVGNLLPEISSKLQENFPNETFADNEEEDEGTDSDLELDLGDVTVDSQHGLLNFLETLKDNDQVQQSVIGLCDIVVESRKQKRNGQAAYKAINEANTKLLSVELSGADKTTYEGINNQLQAISQRVNILLKEMERLQTAVVE